MTRLLASTCFFLGILWIEWAFIRFLPLPWSAAPLMFALAVSSIQHLSSSVGLWWLVGYGFFLDAWGLGEAPGETVGLTIVAVLAFILSQRIFTNRSLYGVTGCASVSWVAFGVWHFLVLLIVEGKNLDMVPFGAVASYMLWQWILLLALVSLSFSISGRLKKVFLRASLMSSWR
jgi:hypothetical protein